MAALSADPLLWIFTGISAVFPERRVCPPHFPKDLPWQTQRSEGVYRQHDERSMSGAVQQVALIPTVVTTLILVLMVSW